jgi:F-type H+-transporting ATPase subunit delta
MKITRQIRQRAKEMFRACLVGGTFDDQRAQAMVQELIQSRERNWLGILSYFHYLAKIDRDEHSALVESAVPLAADLQARIRDGLARNYKRKLETSFVANPALIGGLRIKVGSDVYDGSVQGRLHALEESF